MQPPDPLYCRLYADADVDLGDLVREISRQTGGFIDGWNVLAPWGTLYIRPNRQFDPLPPISPQGKFTSYRFYMDVMPVEKTSPETYVAGLERLVQSLVANGYRVAASYAEDK
jgi:hypothetical protein